MLQDTERTDGLILDSLLDFPAKYTFQVVAKGWSNGDAFLEDVRETISGWALEIDAHIIW